MLASETEPTTTMRAVVRDRWGSPDVLRVEEVERPALVDDGVLVRVRAASVNRGDWYALRGKPAIARPMMGGLRRPKSRVLGSDFAGIAEAVGNDVGGIKPGDQVFGSRTGSFAEYVCARQAVALKPPNVSFEQAAAVPVGALTALQGLRDHGSVQPGQRVLVNGASGGVGLFAVQIAKAFGADVTAVCSTGNVDLVRSLGADRVLDYTTEDFSRTGDRYDVVLDVAGSRPWHAVRRVLKARGVLVMVGAPMTTPLLGPLAHTAATRLASIGGSRKAVFYLAKFNPPDMEVLRDLVESGKVKPVVEKSYALADVAEALAYMGTGHVRSKLVITM